MSEKLKPKITSPGEAWMNYVNSKEGHNAEAVTPEYLKPTGKKTQDINFSKGMKVSKLKLKAMDLNLNRAGRFTKTPGKNLPSL